MFGKLFKPNYGNEENIYNYVSKYIDNIKSLLETWIKDNKYSYNKEFIDLFSILLEIEMDIQVLTKKCDPKLRTKLNEAYQKLELCLNKIKNKILSICEESYDDAELMEISAELIKLRNIVMRNINIGAIKETAMELENSDYLKANTSRIYDNIICLENHIYIRKNEIQNNEIKFR